MVGSKLEVRAQLPSTLDVLRTYVSMPLIRRTADGCDGFHTGSEGGKHPQQWMPLCNHRRAFSRRMAARVP